MIAKLGIRFGRVKDGVEEPHGETRTVKIGGGDKSLSSLEAK